MKKNTVRIVLAALLLVLVASFAVTDAASAKNTKKDSKNPPNGQPFDEIWLSLKKLGERIDTIKLTPGPKGDKGEKGDKGDAGPAGLAAKIILTDTKGQSLGGIISIIPGGSSPFTDYIVLVPGRGFLTVRQNTQYTASDNGVRATFPITFPLLDTVYYEAANCQVINGSDVYAITPPVDRVLIGAHGLAHILNPEASNRITRQIQSFFNGTCQNASMSDDFVALTTFNLPFTAPVGPLKVIAQ